jgi:hypothetical protein
VSLVRDYVSVTGEQEIGTTDGPLFPSVEPDEMVAFLSLKADLGHELSSTVAGGTLIDESLTMGGAPNN